ncbi:MAG: hypothetical protein IKJ37_03550 [Kiritimatiellae bacterium]|nr:hypothetical protein [Kiritimatiellia bacterium]
MGVVTSPSGAVIHDMCTVLTRRFPNLEIRLYPVKVQGPGAKEEIVEGIGYFNRISADWIPDVLIVGRGGGSIEDLRAFNEECVVRAVAASSAEASSCVEGCGCGIGAPSFTARSEIASCSQGFVFEE